MKRIRVNWIGHIDSLGTSYSTGIGPTVPLDMSLMEIFRVSSEDDMGTATAIIPDEFLAVALEHGVQILAFARGLGEHGNPKRGAARPKIRSSQHHGEGLSEMKDLTLDRCVAWQWKIAVKKKHPAHAYVSVRTCDDETPDHYGLFVTHRVPMWYESTSARRLIVASMIALGLSALAAVASAVAAWLSLN